MLHFVDDDPDYLGWVTDHPAGYVLNTTRRPSAAYFMLHRDLPDDHPAAALRNDVHRAVEQALRRPGRT